VTALSKEQSKNTQATISCRVTGLTKKLNKVKWTDSDGSSIESGKDEYNIDDGTFKDGSQTTILTVPAAKNTQDATYNCLISSDEWAIKDKSTTVALNIFSKYTQLPR
jgi:hypothetical protein